MRAWTKQEEVKAVQWTGTQFLEIFDLWLESNGNLSIGWSLQCPVEGTFKLYLGGLKLGMSTWIVLEANGHLTYYSNDIFRKRHQLTNPKV